MCLFGAVILSVRQIEIWSVLVPASHFVLVSEYFCSKSLSRSIFDLLYFICYVFKTSNEPVLSHFLPSSNASGEAVDGEDAEEVEKVFEKQMKEQKGFFIRKMKEDGACLFRAIADQVYGDQDMHDRWVGC